jgi:NTE family protein
MTSEQKKVGVAFSGGGARGFAHIGVLRVLQHHGVPIDMVAGTSAGSIIAGAVASGMSLEAIERLAAEMTWRKVTRPSMSPLGLLSNVPLGNLVRRHFPVRDLRECPIPLTALVCDFQTGELVALKDAGDLALAIRASCSVPGVFTPIRTKDGRLIVDGGVLAPMPVEAVRMMGADVVIAIDLLACGASFRSRPRTALGMMIGATMAMLRAAAKAQHYHADIVIQPQIAQFRPDEMGRREELIRLGETAALEKIDDIKKILA